MSKIIFIIILIISLAFLSIDKSINLPYMCINTFKKIEVQNIDLKKPNQDLINKALTYSSINNPFNSKLSNFCNKKEYTNTTLDEQRARILKLYTNLAIYQLNERCSYFGIENNSQPFHFIFLEFINASSAVNEFGNSNWIVDIMVEETSLHLSLRIMINFSVEINTCSSSVMTCDEYTTFPFPKYFIGYPTMDQMIPLPMQVISTGSGIVLSNVGKQPDYPNFKNLYLNQVWMVNSDLVLGTNLETFCNITPAVNDTNLPTSEYPIKRFVKNDVQFSEKNYSDFLEINTDIIDNDTWKPCCGVPENKYHYTGNSETYEQSMVKPSWSNGWIQPAIWRNKWPRLWSEPRDRFEYPSTPASYMWNHLGVMYPKAKPNSTHPGIRWSTQQTPRIPNYWPTITGLPSSGGPNYWLFDPTRGFESTLPHGP
jgi:hypothetical protein